MGATRAHLIRQSLTESAMLAVAGGAAAVLVGAWAIAYLSRVIFIPSALPLYVDFRLDARVIGFTAAATFAAAILTGLIPALHASRASLSTVIKQRPDPLPRRMTARTALVVVQVAISMLVLVAAGLLVQAAGTAQRVDPGFRRDRVLLLSFNPGLVRYDSARTTAFYQQLLERVHEVPGVEAVGLTRFLPLGVNSGSLTLLIDGTRTPDGQGRVSIAETVVDPGYWRVMRTPILQGRVFDDRDTATSPRVAVVNETFAAKFWPGENPLGKTVRIPDVPGPNGAQTLVLEVVGIAGDGKLPGSLPSRHAPSYTGHAHQQPQQEIRGKMAAAREQRVHPSVLDLDPGHHHEAAQHETVARGGGLRRSRLVLHAAEDRRDSRDHRPVLRDAHLYPAPQREHVDHRLAVNSGVPQIDFAATHHRRQLATAKRQRTFVPRDTPPSTAMALIRSFDTPAADDRRRGVDAPCQTRNTPKATSSAGHMSQKLMCTSAVCSSSSQAPMTTKRKPPKAPPIPSRECQILTTPRIISAPGQKRR